MRALTFVAQPACVKVDATSTARPESAPRRGDVPAAEREFLRLGFGGLVRRERVAAGLTQVDLAELLGCSKSVVCRLERGRVRPSETTIARVARALRTGRGERGILLLEIELQRAVGSSLRRQSKRSRDRRTRLDALVLANRAGDPFTDELLSDLGAPRG